MAGCTVPRTAEATSARVVSVKSNLCTETTTTRGCDVATAAARTRTSGKRIAHGSGRSVRLSVTTRLSRAAPAITVSRPQMVGTTIVTSTESPTAVIVGTRESDAVAAWTVYVEATRGYDDAIGTSGDGPTTWSVHAATATERHTSAARRIW